MSLAWRRCPVVNDPEVTSSEAAVIAGLAIAGMDLGNVDGAPFIVLPPGYTTQDLSEHLAAPTRIRANVSLDVLRSFVEYVVKHKGEHSRIYFMRSEARNDRGPRFVCIVDDNGNSDDKADWRQHTATLALLHSRQYATWTRANKTPVAQDAFVEFIEANLPDIVSPDGAELLELCRNLDITKSASFSSMTRTQHDSVSFAYSEETKAGKGVISVPTKLTISIPIFERGPHAQIEAKFKFTLNEGRLRLSYELLRLPDILDDAIDLAVDEVGDKTELTVLYGNPNI
jgi:uncharacterized protein YfdQ (DUF2303 family)